MAKLSLTEIPERNENTIKSESNEWRGKVSKHSRIRIAILQNKEQW